MTFALMGCIFAVVLAQKDERKVIAMTDQTNIACPACGAEIALGLSVCPICGAELRETNEKNGSAYSTFGNLDMSGSDSTAGQDAESGESLLEEVENLEEAAGDIIENAGEGAAEAGSSIADGVIDFVGALFDGN